MTLQTALANLDPLPGQQSRYILADDMKAALTDVYNTIVGQINNLPPGADGAQGPPGVPGPAGPPGQGVLALEVGNPVPAGTPHGTVIVRYQP